MADYIYLLENRLSPAQQRAIGALRTIAREGDVTIFLTGGAVRDLTTGASVRDLDLTIQGDLSRVRKSLAGAGFTVVGENSAAHQLFLTYVGGVRLELSSAVTVSWPKPGKPKYELGSIIDDLRSRDFTANAMAISLNEGSYGLLMDPLNGIADIENRELRLVSNYGFIEEPSRLIRAVRLMSRLGWQLEEKTRQRYETAKEEDYIAALSSWNKGYELEELFHEEDPIRVLKALENEGWMQHLFPALQSAKANAAALSELYGKQGELQIQGILGQIAAIAFPLVIGKMSGSDESALKKLFARQGFVQEIDSLDARVKEFSAKLTAKEAAAPSAAWKMLHAAEPNLVLAAYFGSKSAPVQAKLKAFLTESPNARLKIPYQTLTEMRITPELPGYNDLLDTLFFELMDGKLSTAEEMKAFLEPFSPPAPPPPPNLRRARAKKEPKGRGKKKAVEVVDEDTPDFDDVPLTVAAEEELDGLDSGLTEEGDLTGPDRGPEPTVEEPIEKVAPLPAKAKTADKKAASTKSVAAPAKPAPAVKTAPVKADVKAAATKAKSAPAPAKKAAPVKAAPVVAKKASATVAPAKKAPTKVAPAKAVKKPAPVVKKAVPVAKKVAPAKKAVATKSAKPAAKKTAVKAAPAKKAPAKAVKVAAKKAAPAKKAPAKSAKKAPAKKSGRR